jgi:EAL domain-containing protein (putative c-di-GMP-specific phosphodiesterase class I)
MSIDDFGTGYSSLSYLRRLPVDALKIDRSFIAELATSGSSLPLIQTIIVLAHNMGLTVVAEGVETREQLNILRSLGCDKVPGHLFGEPMPAAAVEEHLLKLR